MGERVEPPEQVELQKWHRWFAVECNNRAWHLASIPSRTDDQNDEMLRAAYSASFHWSSVGKPIHIARSVMLLAHAHALLGHSELALTYARRFLSFCEHNDCEDWDLAFA